MRGRGHEPKQTMADYAYYDENTWEELDPKQVEKGEKDEFERFCKMGVYEYVSRAEAERDETGKFVKVKWVRTKKAGKRQKHGESKRTRVAKGGPNQRSFTPSEPQHAEGNPGSRMRGTMQSSRCDLAWSPRRVGGPRNSHWRCTGPLARTPEGTRESSEQVTCGNRYRNCWTLKEKRTSKRLTQSAIV